MCTKWDTRLTVLVYESYRCFINMVHTTTLATFQSLSHSKEGESLVHSITCIMSRVYTMQLHDMGQGEQRGEMKWGRVECIEGQKKGRGQ